MREIRSVARAAAGWALLWGGLALATPRLSAHPAIEVQLAEVDALLACEPARAELHARRGHLLRMHAEWAAADAAYARARELEPGRIEVDLWRAELHLESGAPAEAKRLLDGLLAARPSFTPARTLRARAEQRLGRPLEAAADYAIAIAQAQDAEPEPDLYLERARALRAAGGVHALEALECLDAGLAKLGRPIALEVEALDLELALGRHDAALARIDALLSLPGRREAWLLRRAEVLEAAGRGAAALAAYEQTLAAIEALDAARRARRATRSLETSAREALARLAPVRVDG